MNQIHNLALYFFKIHFNIVTCSGTGDAFRIVTSFIYDFTSRHYNYFYNVRPSLPCWFFILVGPLIAGFLVAALIWLLWSPLTLRLWSALLISRFYCSPPWNRVLAPRIEDTLSKGAFFWLRLGVAVGIQQFGLFVVTGSCFHSLLLMCSLPSNVRHRILLSGATSQYYPSIYVWAVLVVSLIFRFAHQKFVTISLPCVLCVLYVSSSLTWLFYCLFGTEMSVGRQSGERFTVCHVLVEWRWGGPSPLTCLFRQTVLIFE
jgi:hypothetical protein